MSYGRRAYEPVDVRSLFWVKKVYGMQDSGTQRDMMANVRKNLRKMLQKFQLLFFLKKIIIKKKNNKKINKYWN